MWQSKVSASPPRWSLPELCTLCAKILARSALYPDSKVVCPNRQMKVQRREFPGPRSRVPLLRASLGRCRGLVRCTPACLPERQTLCKVVSPPLLPAPLPHLMPSRELCAQPRGSDSQLPQAVQDRRSLPTVCTPSSSFQPGLLISGKELPASELKIPSRTLETSTTAMLRLPRALLVLFQPPAPQRLLGAWGGQAPGSHLTPALWRLPPPSAFHFLSAPPALGQRKR